MRVWVDRQERDYWSVIICVGVCSRQTRSSLAPSCTWSLPRTSSLQRALGDGEAIEGEEGMGEEGVGEEGMGGEGVGGEGEMEMEMEGAGGEAGMVEVEVEVSPIFRWETAIGPALILSKCKICLLH